MEEEHSNTEEHSRKRMNGELETDSTLSNNGEICQTIQTWKREQDADSLIRSPEMPAFLISSGQMMKEITCVTMHGAGVVVFVAFLPITVPFRIMGHTAEIILGACFHLTSSSLAIVNDTFNPSGEDTASFSLIDGFIHHVSHAVPTVLHAAETIKNDIGGLIMGALSPLLGNEQPREHSSAAGESSSENESYLDRLRLDLHLGNKTKYSSEDNEGKLSDCNFDTEGSSYVGEVNKKESSYVGEVNKKEPSYVGEVYKKETSYVGEVNKKEPSYVGEVNKKENVRVATSSDVSMFLLRVDDLELYMDNEKQRLMYIDMNPVFQNEHITSKALETLYLNGLALVSLGMECPPRKEFGIDWKPEGVTSRLLKKKEVGMSLEAWYSTMQKNVMIWSGSFQGIPAFLSRGIVPGSPRDIFDLLWDSQRTTEYNEYSMGRSDVLIIENANDISKERAIKVAKSKTKVPYTSFSAVIWNLMYGCALVKDDNDNNTAGESFLIISRSLASGGAGYHINNKRIEHDQKNEVRWSVNLLRVVPDQAKLTELISLSQITSSMIPQFLAHRVGISAVNNCFKSLRIR